MSGATGRAILAGEAAVRFRADRSQLTKGMRLASKELQTFANNVNTIGNALAVTGGAITAAFVAPVREFAQTEQLLGRFSAVFKDLEKDAGKFSETLADRIGQSTLEIKDQLAQFQAFLKGAGFEGTDALGLSKTLTAATQDLIAFDDTIVNSQQATTKLLSILSGEVEPGRRLGADVRVAAVDQQLLAKGIAASSAAATEQQKIFARSEILLEAFTRSGVTGQAVAEVNTLASLFRAFSARVRDLSTAIGAALAPAMQDLTQKANRAIARFTKLVEANGELVIKAAELGAKMLGLGIALKGVAIAASSAAKALTTLRASMIAIAAGKPAAIFTAIGVAAGALVLSSEEARAGIDRAFEGIEERFEQARGIILAALDSKQYSEALRLLTLSLEREAIRLGQEFGSIGVLVVDWLQKSIEQLKFFGRVAVSIFESIGNAAGLLGGQLDEALAGVAAVPAAMQQARLRQINREMDALSQPSTGPQAGDSPAAARTDEALRRRDAMFDESTRTIDTLGRSEFGVIATAIANAIKKQPIVGVLGKQVERVADKVERQGKILLQAQRIAVERRRSDLEEQATAIRNSFRGESAATFGGATRLAFGIGETKVDEEQLTALQAIEEILEKMADDEFVLAAAGT